MDWLQEMTACWLRILTAAGDGRTPLDEAVHQISAIGGKPPQEWQAEAESPGSR